MKTVKIDGQASPKPYESNKTDEPSSINIILKMEHPFSKRQIPHKLLIEKELWGLLDSLSLTHLQFWRGRKLTMKMWNNICRLVKRTWVWFSRNLCGEKIIFLFKIKCSAYPSPVNSLTCFLLFFLFFFLIEALYWYLLYQNNLSFAKQNTSQFCKIK